MLHAPNAAVDGHVVVIQYDEQVVGCGRSIVQSFESQSAAHAPVANHGHHVAVVFAFALGGHSHAQSCGNRIGSMPAGECVIFTLVGRREGADALECPVGVEGFSPAGQNLVSVGLVSHVPYNAVVRRVEDIMKCHRQLYRTQIGSHMPGIVRDFFKNVPPQFLANLRQLFCIEFPQVCRRADSCKQRVCICVSLHLYLKRYKMQK